VFIICFLVSWSAKGKQLAIALQSGDIITFSPSETQQAKSFIARPSSMQGQSIIHTTWLSNPAFYAIFAPVGPLNPQADQKHMVIVHDAKRSDASADITLPINFFPSGVRPPGAFTIALKGWDPAKIVLLVGDSTTSDIGLVCCTADDKWQKLSFDEGAPSMPLDADQNETTMIGFELDLKNTTPYDATTSTGETVSVPPPPVVWAYASDGTVIAWYVVNSRGTPYPGKGQLAAQFTCSRARRRICSSGQHRFLKLLPLPLVEPIDIWSILPFLVSPPRRSALPLLSASPGSGRPRQLGLRLDKLLPLGTLLSGQHRRHLGRLLPRGRLRLVEPSQPSRSSPV
jgi:hypothetical protein